MLPLAQSKEARNMEIRKHCVEIMIINERKIEAGKGEQEKKRRMRVCCQFSVALQ